MSGRGKGKSVAAPQEPSAVEVAPAGDRAGKQDSRRTEATSPAVAAAAATVRSKSASAIASPTRRCSTARSSHISALKGARNRAGSYQRLEFLGDHVLGLVISDMLFRAFPKADEGELSRRLADLVRKETCAEIARAIDLGAAIRLGSSEANAGGRTRPAILADVCEALIGAVYLDGGFHAAEALVGRLWEARMRTTAQPLRDPKTVLQEWAQARGLPTPAYREVARSGPDHDPEFRVAVQLPQACARRRLGPLQARRRAGRRRRHAGARGRQARRADG